jgi:phosphoglycolate phosphatase
VTAVIFDLDGTLLDTLDDLKDATNAALDAFGYPKRSLEEVRQFVGNGAARLLAQAVPEGADSAPVLSWFKKYYDTHCRIKTAPYPGILEVLKQIDGKYPMAIVSNKPDTAVKALCADYFPGIFAIGEHPGCPRKPAADMVMQAMDAIGATSCIYVGDSEVDVETAKNAGVPCLSVLWGFRDRALLEQAGATHFCTQPAALLAQIENLLLQEK